MFLDAGHLEVDALRRGFLSDPLRLPFRRGTNLLGLDLAVLQPAIEDRLLGFVVNDFQNGEGLVERPRDGEC